MDNTGGRAPGPRFGAGQGSTFAQKFPLATRTALILLWFLGFVAVFVAVRHLVSGGPMGQDSHAYWLAAQGKLSYSRPPGYLDAYLYSPAFAAVIRPLALLPWPLFSALWLALQVAAAAWLVKPLRARWAIPTFLLCAPEMVVGNIYIFLAVVAVLGMRWPGAWSFAVLTKVTTGVGLLWFAARGEWKRLFQGAGTTALIVAASYLVEPSAWHDWVRFLLENRDGTPDSRTSFVLRCLLAAALVVFGARKQWPFLIAPAVALASPVMAHVVVWIVLIALPRLFLISGPGHMDQVSDGRPSRA